MLAASIDIAKMRVARLALRQAGDKPFALRAVDDLPGCIAGARGDAVDEEVWLALEQLEEVRSRRTHALEGPLAESNRLAVPGDALQGLEVEVVEGVQDDGH